MLFQELDAIDLIGTLAGEGFTQFRLRNGFGDITLKGTRAERANLIVDWIHEEASSASLTDAQYLRDLAQRLDENIEVCERDPGPGMRFDRAELGLP